MREVNVDKVTENIKEMCIEANHFLTDDMKKVFKNAVVSEKSPLGKQVLNQLNENLDIAANDMIPICQDTGMAVVFINVGQDVHFTGGNITDAINEGVRQGYVEGFLRKSVVNDPIIRENTKDNTPAVIHYNIVPGDKVDITVAPKGFGSENMSRVFMLKPADGIEGVKDAILTAVKDAGPNACPPMVIGVGIGGTFEKCALLAKKALTRNVEEESPVPYVRELEKEMLEKMELSEKKDSHPFDLSVGQQQRLAIGKVLLLKPDVLMLDEPTKGIDGEFKKKLAVMFDEMKRAGIAVVIVSHDIDFCAENADECGLLFDGELTKMQTAEEFFRQNYFYTTDICRIFSDIYDEQADLYGFVTDDRKSDINRNKIYKKTDVRQMESKRICLPVNYRQAVELFEK